MHRSLALRTGATRACLVSLTLALAAAGCEVAMTAPHTPNDIVAPMITGAQDFNATNRPTATIMGTVTDSVGVESVFYRVNGGAEQPVKITPGVSVDFAATVPVSQPTNEVELVAYDDAGNRAVKLVFVMYDTEPPALSVSRLVNGGSFSSFLRLDGSAGDTGSGMYMVTYRVNGGAETPITGGHKSPTSGFVFSGDAYGLPLGPNTFVVTAYDRAGNRRELTAVMTRTQ